MGVGKTATCKQLKTRLNNCVFLDGDWCWDANPFQVTEETKNMVQNNICYLLNSFIHCSVYENIIFCWVMHDQNIINNILSKLDTSECNVKVISLVCTKDALVKRLKTDVDNGIRSEDVIARSISRIPLYEVLDTVKIDTTDKSIVEVADIIINHKGELHGQSRSDCGKA